MGAQLTRRAARGHAGASLRGLRSPGAWKNGWQSAAINGATTPYGVQPLLGRAPWDAEALRDDGRPEVREPLGASQAMGVLEETGGLTKGQQAAGGARQERGPGGRGDHGHRGGLVT
jgi:SRSO17 transposase